MAKLIINERDTLLWKFDNHNLSLPFHFLEILLSEHEVLRRIELSRASIRKGCLPKYIFLIFACLLFDFRMSL
jgi:hypothetical protein